jgi:hypothetical protein
MLPSNHVIPPQCPSSNPQFPQPTVGAVGENTAGGMARFGAVQDGTVGVLRVKKGHLSRKCDDFLLVQAPNVKRLMLKYENNSKNNKKTCCQKRVICLLSALMHRFGAGGQIVFCPMKNA